MSMEVNQDEPQTATLELSIDVNSVGETVDVKKLDDLLRPREGGPIIETLKTKEKRVFLSFKDALERGKAKHLLGTAQASTWSFSDIREVPQSKLYPVVVRNANISDLDDLKGELTLRNKYIGDTLRFMRPIHKSAADPSIGHVKLLFSSKKSRELALRKGRIFAGGGA